MIIDLGKLVELRLTYAGLLFYWHEKIDGYGPTEVVPSPSRKRRRRVTQIRVFESEGEGLTTELAEPDTFDEVIPVEQRGLQEPDCVLFEDEPFLTLAVTAIENYVNNLVAAEAERREEERQNR